MAKNTGDYFGNNFIKGWKRSFDIKTKTNYADYSSFLGFNFVIIVSLCFLAWNFSQIFKHLIILYLLADILPMTSIVLRRLKDAGCDQRNIFWIFLPLLGWGKLRNKLSLPSLGEKNLYEGMSIKEKKLSKFFLRFLPWLTYKFPILFATIWAGILSILGFLDPFGIFWPVLLVIPILAVIAIPAFVGVQANARASAVKNGLVNGVKECVMRDSEKLSTTFLDALSFSQNYSGYKIQPLDAKSCFKAKANQENKEETWFEIDLNNQTGEVSKTCGDSSKPGCEEGNTW